MIVLPYTEHVAVTWGHISACALAYNLPLATLNTKDFEDYADHEGLTLITS